MLRFKHSSGFVNSYELLEKVVIDSPALAKAGAKQSRQFNEVPAKTANYVTYLNSETITASGAP